MVPSCCKKGNAIAQNNLGIIYSIGIGVPKILIKAYVWTSTASAQGNEQAKINRDSGPQTHATATRASLEEG